MAKRCVAEDGFWKRKKCTKDCIYYDTCKLKDNKERLAELEEQEKEYRNLIFALTVEQVSSKKKRGNENG